ncbi:unnamed protein product, partial [Dovyalis caffra]
MAKNNSRKTTFNAKLEFLYIKYTITALVNAEGSTKFQPLPIARSTLPSENQ